MIIERKSQINIPTLKERRERLLSEFPQIFEGEDYEVQIMKLAELMQLYNAAMKETSTKLEILDDEFQLTHKHNPIHHLECRIKGLPSIYEKMKRYGVPIVLGSAKDFIRDIAGIRVVCNFIDDIYTIEKMLLNQTDIELIERKDYIANPKTNGYRSLHLVVKVPVFLSQKNEDVPVEIQLRTIAMDYWASLEHMLRYKNDTSDMQEYSVMLIDCANTLAKTEKNMQYIRENIEK